MNPYQDGIVLQQIINPESSKYNIGIIIRFDLGIDESVLKSAFERLVSFHDILRSRFELSGAGLSIVDADCPPQWSHQKLKFGDDVSGVAKAFCSEPFDVLKTSLIRALFIEHGSQSALVLSIHHAIADGPAVEILLKDLQSFANGKTIESPSPPLDNGSTSTHLSPEILEQAVNAYVDVYEPLRLSFQLQCESAGSATAVERLSISPELVDQIKRRSQEMRIPTFSWYLAIYAFVLHKRSGQDKIAIPYPVSCRSAETLETITNLANTVIAYFDFSKLTHFSALLDQSVKCLYSGLETRRVPFSSIFREVVHQTKRVDHDLKFKTFLTARTITNSTFVYQDNTGIVEDVFPDEIKADLAFAIERKQEVANLRISYDPRLFYPGEITSMLDAFRECLKASMRDVNIALSDINTQSPELLRDQLRIGSGGFVEAQSNLAGLFERLASCAIEFKGRVAVLDDEGVLTYEQLFDQARDLSRGILAHQRKKGRYRVGVALDRSSRYVPLLFAIWRSGATVVPIDTNWPEARIEKMVNDLALDIIVTNENVSAQKLPRSVTVVSYDSLFLKEITDIRPVEDDFAAYIMYSSGSTGSPKGIEISQDGLLCFLDWALSEYTANDLRQVLCFSPFTFDISLFEILTPIFAGGSVRVLEHVRELIADSRKFSEASMINTVPSILHTLLGQGVVQNIDVIVLVGEILSGDLVRSAFAENQNLRIYNVYGPTEESIYSTMNLMTAPPRGDPHIGKPIPGTNAIVLDDTQNIALSGAPGTLYLTGRGLALGYIGQEPGFGKGLPNLGLKDRWYNTSDRVRWDSANNLEFLGRLNRMVKVRGLRVDLSEIEKCCTNVDGVNRAFAKVVGKPGTPECSITCYIETSLDPDEIEISVSDHIKEMLPAYMVPSQFRAIDKFPELRNGKIDAKGRFEPSQQNNIIKNFSGIEAEVAKCWTKTLGHAPESSDSSFIMSGGTSLTFLQLISKLKSRFKREIDLGRALKADTLSQLTNLVLSSVPFDTFQVETQSIQTRTDVRLSLSQEELYFLTLATSDDASLKLVLQFEISADFNIDIFETAIRKLLHRHPVLNSRVKMTADGPVISVLREFSCLLTVQYSDEALSDTFVTRTIETERLLPIDIHAGRPVRFSIVLTEDGRGVLTMLLHHIAVDGWSANVIMSDLNFFYEQALAGRDTEALAPCEDFFSYASVTRAWHESDSAKPSLSFWKSAVRDPEVYSKLSNRIKGERFDLSYDTVVFGANESSSGSLGYFPAVPFMAAYGRLISNVLDLSSVLIHFPFSARSLGSYEMMVGPSTSNLFIELRDVKSLTDSELLEYVQDQLVLAIEHGELQQNVLRLQGELPSYSVPIFGFNYLDFPNKAVVDFAGSAKRISSRQLNQNIFAVEALQLFITPNDGHHDLRWGFSQGFFSEVEVQRIQAEFKTIIGNLTD